MSPWFQAKLWFVRAGMKAHGPGGVGGFAHVTGDAPLVAKKNHSGSANAVNVGVRYGSDVTMCKVFMAAGSASATMMLFSTALVYGFGQLSWLISRSRFRTRGSVESRSGFDAVPLTYTVGASSA